MHRGTFRGRKSRSCLDFLSSTSAEDWYLNLQGSWHKIHDFEKQILYLEADNISLLGEISKPVWRGNLEPTLTFNYSLTDDSCFLQPAVKLKYFRNTELETGAIIFKGESNTLMGSYDQADQFYANLKFFF